MRAASECSGHKVHRSLTHTHSPALYFRWLISCHSNQYEISRWTGCGSISSCRHSSNTCCTVPNSPSSNIRIATGWKVVANVASLKDALSTLLPGFSRFCVLKKKHREKHWRQWPSDDDETASEEIHFHMFLQFLSFGQMKVWLGVRWPQCETLRSQCVLSIGTSVCSK